MDARDAARHMVDVSGLTQRQIETRAGRFNGWAAQSLARPRPGADLLASIATACGYRLELVPIDGGPSITIGADSPDLDDAAPSLQDARAMLARASAILDQLDGQR